MQFHNAVKMDDYTLKIHVDSENSVKQIMQFLLEKSIAIERIEKCENTLENLFMEVVGK